jgi:hypothetical protein
MTRLYTILFCPLLVLLLAGCPSGWGEPDPGDDDDDDLFDDDDDASDDDDAVDDDDTGSETSPEYPTEEAFFGLALGNTWRYDETVSTDIVPVEDDVFVEVVARWWGPDMDPAWGEEFVAFEFYIDRLYGDDVTIWYGLDGSGSMKWLKTRFWLDFFEYEDEEGDGTVVMSAGADEEALLGSVYNGAWFLTDRLDFDFSSAADTIETFMYGEGEEVEALGLLISEHSTQVGLQYFKASWGILGQEVEVGGAATLWTVTECSICPPEANL